ncbi:MAG TPA: polysaccharide biosynthesis tyrosine autokinase [Vicinamibacteria bacterium]|nr:polysaccharide biosynthesis tyrosine autokinase [Vicinamibacteria bacterium]
MATHPPPALSDADAGAFDGRYYAGLLWRHRGALLAAALVGLALGGLVSLLQTPEYRASAMIQIEPPAPLFLGVTDALVSGGNYWHNTDFYNTQFKILRSTSLGDKVVERLRLKDRPPFKDSAGAGALFVSHVSVEPIPDSRLVLVQVTHTDPKEAALWANTLADEYIRQSLETRVEAARKAYDWLQERLQATQQNMREAQDRLYRSYQGQELFVPEGEVSAVTASIAKLNEDYIDTQSRRIVLEAALNQLEEMDTQKQSLESVPQVAADAMILSFGSQLAGLNLEMSRLREKYKEGHPEVQKVQAQLEQIQKARDARAHQIVEGIRAEHGQLQRREAELRETIDRQKAQAATQSRKASELEALKKEAESAKNLYSVLLQKLNETDIAASLRSSTATLVERAMEPAAPARPDRPRIAGIGLLLGLVLGVGFVIGRDHLDNSLKDPDDVERYLHLDLLTSVPRYEDASAHLVTEAYQNLRTALLFARRGEAGHVVLVTGTAPQEGKTTTLVNLAALLAASGERTAVVDFDLRRADLHARLGLSREPGVTSLLLRQEPLETLIRATETPGLDAITAGALPPNPPALLARKDLPELLHRLRGQFDWVLVDSPPLASVTDALLLARHADLVVLVVRHNEVDKRLIKRTVNALRRSGAEILGAVLNAVDAAAKGSYYYYHQEQKAPARGLARLLGSGRP